jgi:hypothetical protein
LPSCAGHWQTRWSVASLYGPSLWSCCGASSPLRHGIRRGDFPLPVDELAPPPERDGPPKPTDHHRPSLPLIPKSATIRWQCGILERKRLRYWPFNSATHRATWQSYPWARRPGPTPPAPRSRHEIEIKWHRRTLASLLVGQFLFTQWPDMVKKPFAVGVAGGALQFCCPRTTDPLGRA